MVFYKIYSKNLRSNFQAGFLLNFCSMSSEEKRNSSKTDKSNTSLGILVGYAGSIVEKNKFFLRFLTQFKHVPPIKLSSEDGFLANEQIGLSSLFLGIQTGYKIYIK